MGIPKATLPFGPELMLPRVVRLLGDAVRPIVVVAASGQPLPSLSPETLVARDVNEGRGPLEGIFAGLTTLSPLVDAAFVTACDVPLLVPAFVTRMIELLGDQEIVVTSDGDFQHPLAAVYRTSVIDRVAKLLAADQLRPVFLFDMVNTRIVPVETLRDVDPELATLRNLNRPEDYFAALEYAGFEANAEVRAQVNSL
jgi:molybdenum cofactor guanylyltransferase